MHTHAHTHITIHTHPPTPKYRSGVAFPDCVTFGYEHAKEVVQYLEEQGGGPSAKGGAAVPAPSVEAEKVGAIA